MLCNAIIIIIIIQIQFPVSEITCVVGCSEPGNPRIAVHTPKLNRSKVIRLQFASDTEMEDWLAHLTSGNDTRKINRYIRIIYEKAMYKGTFFLFFSILPDE